MTVIYIMILVLAAMAFIVLEVLTPSFGLLALLSMAAAAGAVYFCFTISQTAGLICLLALAIGLPMYALAVVHYLPRTRLARGVLLAPQEVAPGDATRPAQGLVELVGKEGLTQTVLRPSGLVRIDGTRYDAQSEGRHIEAGVRVKVVHASGNNLVVRPVEQHS